MANCGDCYSTIHKMVFLGLENYFLNKCCRSKPTLPVSQPQVRDPVPSESELFPVTCQPKSPFRNAGLTAMATRGADPPTNCLGRIQRRSCSLPGAATSENKLPWGKKGLQLGATLKDPFSCRSPQSATGTASQPTGILNPLSPFPRGLPNQRPLH